MDLRKLYIASLTLFAAVCLISCKDDEEDESKPYLDNNPVFTLDSYITAGATVTMEAEEVTNATGDEVTYTWSVTRGSKSVSFEDGENKGRTFTFTFAGSDGADTLCNFTVSCSAASDNYYGTSWSAATTAVNGNSLASEGDSPLADGVTEGSWTDAEGNEYRTVTVGGKEWLAENLAVSTSGAPLENAEAVSSIFGRFYTWDEAVAVCEALGDGWRLPTTEDWQSLGEWEGITGSMMTNVYFNNTEMWEYWPAVQVTNTTGLSVIPTGYATVLDREGQSRIWTFFGMTEYAGFWTADEHETGTGAYYVYMYDNRPDLLLNYTDKKSFALPVRCVR